MENYGAMIRNTFEFGSVIDAQSLFETCVKNAFPSSSFRRLELIRFLRERQYIEGRSWNHVFEIHADTYQDHKVWRVRCQRVTMGRTPDKEVYLDYDSLGFIDYVK